MKKLRGQLMATQAWLEARLKGQRLPKPEGLLSQNEQLWEPLYACYKSLQACGMGIIANGELLDTLRRVKCFGVPLVRIDVRQESTRHTEALGELTRYLGIGDYESWSEADKQAFLIRELNSKRPLLPRNWEPSNETREVLNTCKAIVDAPKGSVAAYVISMAKTPSDVLGVHLLLKEAGIDYALPVAPLFETLDDLNNANDVMTQLLNIDWYRGFIQGKQMVMIGYSDSAKDAGVMAASWAQYQAQDALIKTCEKAGIELTLFHGRGGSIGRGGAPARGTAVAAAGKPERRPARHRAGRDDPLQVRSAGSDHQQPVALYQRHSGSQPAAAAGAESVLVPHHGRAVGYLLRSVPRLRA
jgi:phosphoenolpyruvate carboxylase